MDSNARPTAGTGGAVAATHHSSPHPRAVQSPLIDQQIVSALPLAQ